MNARTTHLHRLLSRLARREGYAFATEAALGRMLGRSERTVQRQIRQLKAAGEIRIERPSRTSTNRIFVLSAPERVGSNVGSRARKVSGRYRETIEFTQETAAAVAPPIATNAAVLLSKKIEREPVEQPLPIVAEQLAQGLIESLSRHGVFPDRAAKLVAKYPPCRIERQIRALPFRAAEDPTRVLVASIRDDYPEPKALRDDRDRRDRQRAKDDADRDRREREAADRAAQERAAALAADRRAQLDAREWEALKHQARVRVDARTNLTVRTLTPPRLYEMWVEAQAREMLGMPSSTGG